MKYNDPQSLVAEDTSVNHPVIEPIKGGPDFVSQPAGTVKDIGDSALVPDKITLKEVSDMAPLNVELVADSNANNVVVNPVAGGPDVFSAQDQQ